ncbi:MAG: hypothetical protein M1830_001224 [Pleopsidium flavum]|nr:MAG: hypothetical protein M1830_001224 [Pleopsidium flavum]
MPLGSLFSLPLNPSQHPLSLRASLYKPTKKRKREGEDSEDQPETSDAAPSQETSGKASSSSAALSPDEKHQYLVAGQPFDEDLPGKHFPHAPSSSGVKEGLKEGQTADARLRKELAELSPPLYPPKGSLITPTSAEESQSGVGLRLRHLAVLTTILHRCLLESDFIRAGRAWGMLLRIEVHGWPIDLRAQGRWGIGAEILIRRDMQVAERRERRRSDDSSGDEDMEREEEEQSKVRFSKEGFDKARMYYERLILQYPYRKTFPHAVSSLDFYPAMFGLWIYSIQEESRIAKADLRHPSADAGSEDEQQLYDDNAGQTHSPIQGEQRASQPYEQLEDLRKSELQQAGLIATRLDELLLSPPYSDSHELLKLRGMIALWVGDLSIVSDREHELPSEQSIDAEEPDELLD